MYMYTGISVARQSQINLLIISVHVVEYNQAVRLYIPLSDLPVL